MGVEVGDGPRELGIGRTRFERMKAISACSLASRTLSQPG
jgi:hypothetical protein